ncbi:MAG: DUF1127 domain-containing protein [Roseovarius sp.]
MAAIETTRTAPHGVGSLFSRLVATVSAWNDARVTRNALNRLSDRELADIGLSRSDIENAIR